VLLSMAGTGPIRGLKKGGEVIPIFARFAGGGANSESQNKPRDSAPSQPEDQV